MIQRDYIMRMIEQFTAFLFAIVFNKKTENYDIALEKIEEAYNGLLHLNGDEIKKLDISEIIKNNSHENVLAKDNIEIIATLLFEEADIIEKINGTNNTSLEYYKKSLKLFFALLKEADAQKVRENIAEITGKLANYKIDNGLTYKMYEYYVKMESYGKAEDKLYELLERNHPGIKDEIKTFYETLLEKDDAILAKGNLPREEIIEAIEKLENKGA